MGSIQQQRKNPDVSIQFFIGENCKNHKSIKAIILFMKGKHGSRTNRNRRV